MLNFDKGAAGSTVAEQAAVQKATAFLGGFAPAHLEQPAPDAASAAPTTPPAPEVKLDTPAEAPKEKTKEDLEREALVEIMREQREARKAREAEDTKAKDLSAKYAEAQAEIERLKQANDFEADPVAYARARGWNKEQQALMGQMLLYDLVPDKAPPDLRIKLFESKQEREKRAESEKRQAEQAKAQQAEAQQQFQQFVTVLDAAVAQFDEGSFPESTAWFIGPQGDLDRDNYVRALVATAHSMADEAARSNQVADLSPASIAKRLEADVAARMKARESKVQKRTKPVAAAPASQQAPVAGGTQPTESTKGLQGAATPRPPALTEAERVQRAIAVLSKPR